jgi:AraC-like DNA-binding protein
MYLWRPPPDIKLAFAQGFAVVQRKNKARQQVVGPSRALADELYAVLEGDLEMYFESRWQPAPPGTLGLFPRKTVYGIRPKPGYRGTVRVVSTLMLLPEDGLPRLPARPVHLPGPWWRKYLALEQSADFDSQGHRVLRVEELSAFMAQLTRALGAPETSVRPRRAGARGAEGPRKPDTQADWMELWARAEDAIRERAKSGLSAAELAELIGVSATQLRRVFHAARGCSPKVALTQFRIEEAKRLLASGRLNVTQVAEKVGFANLPRFSAAFKQATGIAPAHYARKA